MARAFSVSLKSYLAGSMISLANCVKITRLDGQISGFTSLDVDVTIEGLTYSAWTSVDASELASQVGSGVDNLNVVALLSSTKVKETELLAGLWDGAKVELFFWPFDNPSLGRIVLLTGTLGEITEDGGQFTAEIRSLSQRLSQQFVELTSPLCRVRKLFDSRCMPNGSNEGTANGTITPAGCRPSRTVSVVNSTKQITFSGDAGASTLYRYGMVTFTSGLNIGQSREVKEHTQGGGSTAVITLQEPFPFVVAVGDVATLEWGCDRTLSQCTSRFKNFVNHAGEAQLPGTDAILRVGRRR